MPTINRIRVNNIKYNFGTQQYDDFVMRMYGKNTLYDLANGGGKSVLMLLLLQNLIPNCTLDEKQPIEKLFRTGGGNTVIHSLIEWRLDEPDIREGYRYMTTGFCARKAKDAPDGEEGGRELAAVEYFNYCIFYRDYNDNDLVNLPLVQDGERVSYTGWKNYLKELGRRDMRLEVRIFERKGEYQRFISRYGLYESHWEIVRGINKTEGHVRAYFEQHYRTARKVVEDLLIEEIIEKAYRVKVEQNEGADDMARTLLEIKDKLAELSRKKREIADYDRQMELLHVLEGRVATFLELYEERDKQRAQLADICVTGATAAKDREDKMKELEQRQAAQEAQRNSGRLEQERLKIQRGMYRLKHDRQELEQTETAIRQQEAEAEELRQELNRRESMNDYLDYVRERAAKEEQEAAVAAAMNQNGGQLSRLQAMSRERKRRDDGQLRELRQELEETREALRHIQAQTAEQTRLLQEAVTARAVAEHDRTKLEEQSGQTLKQLQKLREELMERGFRNPEELLAELTEQQEQERQSLRELEAELEKTREAYFEQLQQLRRMEEAQKEQTAAIQELEEQSRTYRKQTDTLKRMLDIYGSGIQDKTAEWLTNQDIDALAEQIRQRYLSNVATVAARREALQQKQRRVKELEEGRLIAPTAAAEKVKYYIESRHAMTAVFGMDYLAAREPEERERLLNRHPLLPYGLLVESLEALDTDGHLRELDLGDFFVPVYLRSRLETGTSDGAEKADSCVRYLRRGAQAFVSPQIFREEKRRRQEELEELHAEVVRLEELNKTYQEDLTFVEGLRGIAVLNVEQKLLDGRDALRETEAHLELSRAEAQRLEQERTQQEQRREENRKSLYRQLEERARLEQMSDLSGRLEDVEAERKQTEADCGCLQEQEERCRRELEHMRTQETDAQSRLHLLEEQLHEHLEEWETEFALYYQEEEEEAGGEDWTAYSDSELTAAFRAERAVLEKRTIVLEDKQKLIQALRTSMEKVRKAILRRGGSMEELETLWKTHSLLPLSGQELERLSTEYSRLSLEADAARHQLESKRQAVSRMEGSLEQAVRVLEERFGAYEETAIAEEEIEQALADGAARLSHLEQTYRESRRAYQQYAGEYSAMLDLYKDVKRIVETNGIPLHQAKTLLIDREELRGVFETALSAYDKSVKALDRAQNELLRYKGQTAQALTQLQAYELAQTISSGVELPGNLGEARELRENLASMIQVIALEKERVEEGITDMQILKSNFEKQCIQRCLDVRNELEKLPQLSRIQLEGETIQMVGLTVPYVREAQIAQRMSEYIDDIVAGADRMQSPNDRMKYIRSRLELKRLFGVLVTDMNAIRLTLYKRERLKEQSRYLRYEEAVGSTGQSQGIYIQFLVSIIHYISGIYAPNGETEKLTKTIFIDNPFGAAKDVYIWEPIFALLKANRVQLIVPARGATPAITARFDVNYILGQQMVGGRQQTVVAEYRSQVEQDELEYRNLEYEQASFDFI